MPSDLSPAEREDREIERLIDRGRKNPKSRKYGPKRGPKHDNRRQRMDTEPDSEKDAPKKTTNSTSLADIALRIFLAEASPELNKVWM